MNVGDRVIVNGEYDGLEFKDASGTIIVKTMPIVDVGNVIFCVDFDDYIGGYSYSGGKPGHCWFVRESMLKKETNMKDRIKELEKELAALKEQCKYEPQEGEFLVVGDGIVKQAYHHDYRKFGRAFNTKEKAEKARDIMLKHDIILKYVIDHAPDYTPDWNNFNEKKFFVWYDSEDKEWIVDNFVAFNPVGMIVMPKWVAEKLVDDLSNGRIDW